jgi:hypothetical protein
MDIADIAAAFFHPTRALAAQTFQAIPVQMPNYTSILIAMLYTSIALNIKYILSGATYPPLTAIIL